MAKRFTVQAEIVAKDRASGEIERVEGRFKRLGNSVKANALKITAALGAVTLAFRELNRSATLQGQTDALRRNLAAQGQDLDTFLSKLDAVARGTISTSKLIESSSKALLLGIPASEISGLLDIARVSAIATGTSVAQAFDDIATGIGRASPLILDNLGIVVKLGPAYEAMADSLGKSTTELTAAEQKQALLNEVLRVGAARIDTFGESQTELALRLQQANAQMENFRNNAGRLGSVLALGLGAVVTRSAAGFVLLARGVTLTVGSIARLASVLPVVGDRMGGIADEALRIDSRLGLVARQMKTVAEQMSAGADVAGSALLGLSDDASAAASAVAKAEEAIESMAGAASGTKSAVEELGQALGVVTSAELAAEIDQITANLAKSRTELGANNREYVRLEAIASEKIERLQDRILNLRDGMGDLRGATEGTADAFVDLGNGVAAASGVLERNTQILDGNTRAQDRNARAATQNSVSGGRGGSAQLHSTQFGSTGTFTFINGRRAQVLPDGRVVFP